MPLDPNRDALLPSHVVVLGASAGGLEALIDFFVNWIPDQHTAFIIVVHLAHDQPSLMDALLAQHTTLTIKPARHGTAIESGHVYLIQPGEILEIRDRHFVVAPRETVGERERHRPIDVCLTSLATTDCKHVVAVILSGTGRDGADGVQRLAAAGGHVLAQDPASAAFSNMPREAIDTGVVQAVLPPGQLADHLYRLVHGANADGLPDISGELLQRTLDLIKLHTRRDFQGFKRGTLIRRLQRRLAALNQDLPTYLRALQDDPREAAALVQELLVRVTCFFRDPPVWETLAKEVLPALIRRRIDRRRLRLWVSGCSTGEEAYGLGMVALEALRQAGETFEVTIFATDIDTDALRHASAGVYSETSLTQCPPHLKERYTNRVGDRFQVVGSVRQAVVFSQHDILQDPPFIDIDLLVCRNVLIYYTSNCQVEVVSRFAFSLNDGGYLLLGASETLPHAANGFEAVDGEHRLYRRVPRASQPLQPRLRLPPIVGGRLLATAFAPQSNAPEMTVAPHPQELWWQRLATNANITALILDAVGTIRHSFGDVSRFCRFAAGSATLRIEDVVVDAFRHQTLALIHASRASGAPATGTNADLQILVEPLPGETSDDPGLLVQFLPNQAVAGTSANSSMQEMDSSERRTLELRVRQLETTGRTLQASLDEATERAALFSSELQSTNEELLSSNEELQSTNEELQSVNEELNTVNAELQEKLQLLEVSNNDLHHLIEGAQVSAVFCDRLLRIRRITANAFRLLGLQQEDVGRPLAQLAVALQQMGGIELRSLAAQAMERQERLSRRFELPGHGGILVTLLPFSVGGSKPAQGLVLTFLPLGEIEQLQSQLDLADQRLRNVLLNMPGVALLLFDQQLRLTDATGAGLSAYGKTPRDLIGQPATSLLTDPDRIRAEALMRGCLAGQSGSLHAVLNRNASLLRFAPAEQSSSGQVQAGMILVFNLTDLRQEVVGASGVL